MPNGNHSDDEIGVGTLFHIAKEHGFQFPKKSINAIGQLAVARYLCASYGDGNLVYVKGRFYCWNGSKWRPVEELELEKAATRAFEELGLSHRVTGSSSKAMLSLARSEVYNPEIEFDRSTDSINFENGELYVSGNGCEFHPHERQRYRLSLLPHDYDKGAKAPRFEQFLDEVFEGDPDRTEKQKALLQFLGLSLTTITRFEKYFILVGEGSNGKSVLLNVIKHMLGTQNISAVDPEQFSNKFQLAYLHGKLANLVPELKEGYQIDDAKIKAIVSSEEMTCEEKFKEPFTFRPYCKLWIAANHLPHTRDVTHAFFRRPIVIEFNRVFEGTECDTSLSEKLRSEIPGIINLAVEALIELLHGGQFTEPVSSKNAKRDWQKDVDQVEQYIEECCTLGPECSCACAALYADYVDWSDSNGIRAKMKQNSVSRRLKRFKVKNVDGTGGRRMFSGIALKNYRQKLSA